MPGVKRQIDPPELLSPSKQFELLVEAATDYAMFLVSPEGIILSWNPGVKNILQWESEEFIGKNFSTIFTREDIEANAPAKEISTAAEHGRAEDVRWHVKKDGSCFFAEGLITCVYDDSGAVHSLAKVMRDRTERHLAEEQLKVYKQRLELTQELARVVSWDWNIDEKKLSWTGNVEAVFGAHVAQNCEADWFFAEVVHPEDRDALQAEAMRCIRERAHWDQEFRIRHANGEIRWLLGQGDFVTDPQRCTHLMGVNLDITEKKTAERAQAKLTEELKRVNEDLERFAFVASHDLQEPLRAMSGFAELLRRKYEDTADSDTRMYLDFIVTGSRRMRALIDRLLEFARLGSQTSEISETDANHALKEALDNLKASIEESHASVSSDRLPTLRIAPSVLTQVFQNLVSNALKYRGARAPEIRISCEKRGTEWLFSVRDNGQGFEMSHASRIFEPFQRLQRKAESPGTGLGLTVCKRVLEQYGGKIWVESVLDQGSVFYFALPL